MRSPMHVSGIGKALPARYSGTRLGRFPAAPPLERFTDKTIVSRLALRAEALPIRARGRQSRAGAIAGRFAALRGPSQTLLIFDTFVSHINLLLTICVSRPPTGPKQGAVTMATLTGIDLAETIIGTSLDDLILGQGGNDTLIGGKGDDVIRGGNGRDRIGGWGGDDLIFGGNGRDYIYGNQGNDTIRGENGRDGLFGNTGDDDLHGGGGRDRLWGGDGNDMLSGGSGGDWLWGEAGDDYLFGGRGWDNLVGGDGSDRFVFTAHDGWRDRVRDFENGVDGIVISAGGVADFAGLTFSDVTTADGIDGLAVRYGSGSFVLDGYSTADVTSGVIGAEDFTFI
jgi:hypothetical protein